MRSNFMAIVILLLIIFLLVAGYKERNTVPLHEAPDIGIFVVLGLVVVGAVYVWWANKRDFK